jgi:hypothetical protein
MKHATPPLLSFSDGSRVTAADWRRRRDELAGAIIAHEYGGMPPEPERTTFELLSKSAARGANGIGRESWEVRVELEGGTLSWLLELWVPGGKGPFPVVLDGDGCWRYYTDAVMTGIVERGCIAAAFNRTAVAADNKERYRHTGIYRLLPDATFGALSAWAWGYHRCVDVLEKLDIVRGDQIAVTGHSRGGKTVLLAGATDERIAVTNPNDSGTGGSGLNRLKGPGAEVVEDFFRSGNIFWFGPGFADYRGRDGELPYDQHFLHAMVAPRGLLVNEAHGDVWANPIGSYLSCLAAREVYELLGDGDAIGWSIREGGHGHTPADYEALMDFIDVRFFGKAPARGFQRTVYCDSDSALG